MIFKDLTGQQFGRWTVLGRAPNGKGGAVRYYCVCSCENRTEKVVAGGSLVFGNTQSCGCLARELTSQRSTMHGHCRGGWRE
jgi:hypothetical protein